MLLLDGTSTDGNSATPGWTGLEAQPSAGGIVGALRVHGRDDLGAVDVVYGGERPERALLGCLAAGSTAPVSYAVISRAS